MNNKINRKFSLITATFGRREALERLLKSLAEQQYKNYELILIDMDPDDDVAALLQKYRSQLTAVTLIKQPRIGLSRARNIGLRQASGDVIAFPDDDCWYPGDLLGQVNGDFDDHSEVAVLTGRVMDPAGKPVAGRFLKKSCPVNKFNLWCTSASVTIFVKSVVAKKVNGFDESLGVGASTRFLASEETDYLLRLLEAGARINYEPEFLVYHPDPVQAFDDQAIKRAYEYGCGAGRVIKKHHYPLWFKLSVLLRPFMAALAWLLTARLKRSQFYFASLKGRIIGLLSPL
ncbi:glycosyltransferase family 2 protein [Candidatus Margulisiibacteriota bacterium]